MEIRNKDHKYQSLPTFQPVQSSLGRRITECFYKIVCNFWRSLASYFQKISLKHETQEKLNSYKDKGDISNWSSVKNELIRKRELGPGTVIAVCEKLIKNKNNDIILIQNFMFNQMSYKLDKNDTAPFVLVPVVIKQGARDHVVAVLYDRKKNRVEFYDPKGLTSADYTENVRCSENNIKLSDVLNEVKRAYGDENTTLWENTTKHQYDSHNCGVYVLRYFERRLNNESPETIAENSDSFKSVNNSLRENYLVQLLE